MRCWPLLSLIFLPLAATAQSAPPGRLFIAPSGEAFRAPADAPYPMATWFAQADHNHDGRIDLTEFSWDFTRFFDTLDLDHDGTLIASEIDQYERQVPELRSGGYGGIGEYGGGGGGAAGLHRDDADAGEGTGGGQSDSTGPAPAYAPGGTARFYEIINIPEPVTAMDLDLSGTITKYEFQRAAVRRFAILDTRQRGYLTLAELPEPEALRHKNPQRWRR